MAKRAPGNSTKAETTGHEWDGVTELNKPLPKWWLWTFYATIVWAIGYWLLMPAWPLVSSYSKGLLGYSQRETVTAEVAAAKTEKSAFRDKIAAMDLTAISNDPELLSFALAGGEAAFGDNCAPCHGRGAQGAVGYPNLRDDFWLWGDGSLAAIHQTILHGIRADDPETHTSQMPAFGRTAILSEAQILDVAEYASLSRATPTTRPRPSAGQRSSAPIAPPVMAPTARVIRSSARQILAMSFGSMPATGGR